MIYAQWYPAMTNDDIFAARVARIKAGAPNTKGTIFVGQDEQHHFGPKASGRQGKGREAGSPLYPLTWLMAFAVGLLAVVLGSAARLRLMTEPVQPDADLEMAVLGGVGLVLSLTLSQVLRLTSIGHKLMQIAGVSVMVCGLHNLAHWAPGPMATLLSPAWVQQVRAEAPVNSARIRGDYFPLLEGRSALAQADLDKPEEAAKPSACISADPGVKLIELDNDTKKSVRPRASVCGG